jgi:metal-responsive CopG/Arc/MetJ family transcriptional regulator
MARDLTRVTVSLPTPLVERVDAYGDSMGIKRTSAVSVLLTMALDNQKAMMDLSELVQLYNKQTGKDGKSRT